MHDNEITDSQRDVVIQTYHMLGQHAADKAVAFYIKWKENNPKEVIQSTTA